MKKRRLALAAVAFILLAGIAIVLVARSLPSARLLALVETRLETALGREVEIGRVHLGLLPLAMVASDVRVRANPGFVAPTLVEIQSLRCNLAVLPLLRRQLDLRSLVIDTPKIWLEQNANGEWNYASTRLVASPAPGTAAAAEAPLALHVRKLVLRGGEIEVRSAKSRIELHLPLAAELVLELERNRRELRVDGWIESSALRANGLAAKLPPLRVRLEPMVGVDLAASSARIEHLRLLVQDLALEMEGQAALRARKPVLHLRTRAQAFELAEVIALLPRERWPQWADVAATGTARLDLTLDLPEAGTPHVDGNITLENGRLSAPHWPAPIEAIRLDASLHGDSLVLRNLEAQVASTPFDADALVFALFDPSATRYDLGLRAGVDLATWTALAATLSRRPLPARVQGNLTVDVRAQGHVAGKELPSWRGTLLFDAVRIETPQLAQPLALQARLRGNGSAFDIESATMTCGTSQLQASGRLQLALPPQAPSLVLRASTARLDLDTVLPAPAVAKDSTTTTGGMATAVNLIPPLPAAHLEIDLDATEAHLKQTTLQRAHLHLQSDSGQFDLALRAASLVHDRLTLRDCEVTLAGAPASSNGQLRARDGHMGKIHASEWSSDILVRGAQVELPNLRARTYDGLLNGKARIDLAEASAPRQELGLEMQKIALGGLLADFFPAGAVVEGTLDGSSNWSAAGSGGAAIRQKLSGAGHGIAIDGRIRHLPLLTQLGQLLGLPQLANLNYRELDFSFAVESGQVQLPKLQLRGDDAEATLQGRIDLDGGLALALGLQLSPALTQAALRQTSSRLGSLFTDAQGRLVLDFDVGGTLRSPRLQPNLQTTAARSGIRVLGEQELRRLLGRVVQPSDSAGSPVRRVLDGAVKGLFQRRPAPADTARKP